MVIVIFTLAKSVCDLHMISCLLQFSFPKQAVYPNLWGFLHRNMKTKKLGFAFSLAMTFLYLLRRDFGPKCHPQ